ncbi:MAG: DUF484 family protein, partial [Pseudomonadota bacterium]|nr:DUF484 family protein [Pseudomonadota bacterium]
MTAKTAKPHDVTAEQVREFLRGHPDFIKKNPDIVADLAPPEQDLGNGIIDFQHYLVKNLQKDSKALKSRYDVLVDFCRDNMSVQAQVHQAALRLIRTLSLEQLLEALTQDLAGLFDVDVVRLGVESDTQIDTSYGEQNYSGIVFVVPGLIDAALGGKKKNVLLVEDAHAAPPEGFEDIFGQLFVDCEGLVASCALLRLELEMVERN